MVVIGVVVVILYLFGCWLCGCCFGILVVVVVVIFFCFIDVGSEVRLYVFMVVFVVILSLILVI